MHDQSNDIDHEKPEELPVNASTSQYGMEHSRLPGRAPRCSRHGPSGALSRGGRR
jgi:hypothetical protein